MFNSLSLYALCAFGLSFVGTYLARRYALSRHLLDIPGERSSHLNETPRGGGVAVVLGVLVTLPLLFMNQLDEGYFWALWGGGLMIALVGYWDDHVSLPAKVRFALQLLLAVAVLWVLGGEVGLGFLRTVGLEWAAPPLVVLGLVWWINLFNFMDGIDGLASSEGVFVLGGASVFLALSGAGFWVEVAAVAVAAVAGFLCWNWAPAKIFLGDVGSYFIGYFIAIFALISLNLHLLPVWVWLVLTALFWVDATYTLLVRMNRGQRWYQPHRSHAYQIAARRLQSHAKASLIASAVNLFWLFPLAALCFYFRNYGPVIALIAVMPLVFVAWRLNAGIANS
ncbi:glycosyltransferase family 4 protein [Motiliproteus sp. SC1-56]|uniref:MraY family glycosyltransferase n=1 Tax=Motiliproteus sp. SC1-56 TaxID=2799565 RepID=UPI001A8F1461|nr:glycosyltransferase family 4 protein [Motiliproteus sp. SC1-56]